MTAEMIKLFLDYGGAVAILGAVVVLVKALKKTSEPMDNLCDTVDNIRDNHLHELKDGMGRIEMKLDSGMKDILNELRDIRISLARKHK